MRLKTAINRGFIKKMLHFFTSALRGKAPLWVVWWGFVVLGYIWVKALSAGYFALAQHLSSTPQWETYRSFYLLLLLPLSIMIFLHAALSVAFVFKCASNTNSTIFAALAKAAVIILVIEKFLHFLA
ncbi:hypothetical protein [Chitinolyticbacter albus]|uniref:hypothetical protein n=1 Tax=Chitinolyticbacter albus TaxID=2961951 RepID=UPI00210E3ACA|nr:hypothetical protein [Chitinolyticbacter albus]